jgi:RNA polymerase sigma factor (sigma-70 family)
MNGPPSERAPDGLAGETDADLLVYMSLAGDDAEAARAAWEQFYRRHVDYLYAVCLRAYGPLLGGEAGAADLVADTFRRAYRFADRFEAAGIADPIRLRRRVRAWLGRIAQRIAFSILRGRPTPAPRQLESDQWQQVAEAPPVPAEEPEQVERVRAALEALTEREQLVLRVTFQWYEPGRAHQRLPNAVAADLARTLRTTPQNLRQIRRRALQKVRAALKDTP